MFGFQGSSARPLDVNGLEPEIENLAKQTKKKKNHTSKTKQISTKFPQGYSDSNWSVGCDDPVVPSRSGTLSL